MRLLQNRLGTILVLIGVGLGTMISCGGGRVYEMLSRAPAREIIVDGKIDEWKGALYVFEEERLLVGMMNDVKDLYLCLVSADGQTSLQLQRRGLVVWFDPAGAKNKVLGFKYPIGAGRQGPPEAMRPDAEEGPPDEELELSLDEIEIMGAKNTPARRTTLVEMKSLGLEFKVSAAAGTFAYELKIPLLSSAERPLAVGAGPGAKIGIGFETGEMSRRRGPGGFPGGMGGGRPGGGGGMGGMGGGMGGRRGMGGMSGLEPFKTWTLVRLASGERLGQPQILSR